MVTKATILRQALVAFSQVEKRAPQSAFVGNKGSWMHEVFSWSRAVPNPFLDDGLGATVLYYDAAKRGTVVSKLSSQRCRLLAMLGIRLAPLGQENMTFFTCFPLPPLDSVEIVQHRFPVFRDLFGLNQDKAGRSVGKGSAIWGRTMGNRRF